jgi:hypothetical protein
MEGGMPTQEQVMQQREKQEKMEEQRSEILQKIMTPEAQERLKRIELVKPEKVRCAQPRSHPHHVPGVCVYGCHRLDSQATHPCHQTSPPLLGSLDRRASCKTWC